jgi:hypothetical protein
MLRNPAYTGTAVFGKTMVVHEPAALNRVARLQNRATPSAVKTADRPREEWIGIPVPARRRTPSGEQALRRAQHHGPLPAPRPDRVRELRIRLLPHLDPHHHPQDLLLPVSGL